MSAMETFQEAGTVAINAIFDITIFDITMFLKASHEQDRVSEYANNVIKHIPKNTLGLAGEKIWLVEKPKPQDMFC